MFRSVLPDAVAGPPKSVPRHPSRRARWILAHRNDLLLRLVYISLGFSPITTLALDTIGWLALATTALFVIMPGIGASIILSLRFPLYGKLALKALVIGLLATLLYDAMRVPFILSGIWSDFIPKISIALLHTTQPNWLVGYTWRYIGDGGFLAIAFTMASSWFISRVDIRIAAVGFGVAVWICLLLTLVLTPRSHAILFPLTLLTFSLSLLGHLIYGTTLGVLLHWWGWSHEATRRSQAAKQSQAPTHAKAVERGAWPLQCAECSERLPSWAHFCGHCGARLNS